MAGTLLASTLAAKGQVIYTDIDPDVELGGAIPEIYPEVTTYSLDLNNDGLFEFKITNSIEGTNPEAIGLDFLQKVDGDFNPQFNEIFTYSLEYAPIAFKLDCEDSIPQNVLFYGSNYAVLAFHFGTFFADHWINVTDTYLGVKFAIGTNVHYGWVRMDANTMDTVPNLVIKDYAYEATPLKKIAACDVGTGINTIEVVSAAVYPNPSSGKGFIRLPQLLNGKVIYTVTDISGREVHRAEFSDGLAGNELPFDLTHLAGGVYLMQINSSTATYQARWNKQTF